VAASAPVIAAPAPSPQEPVYSYYPPYPGAPIAYIDPSNGYGVYLVSPLPTPPPMPAAPPAPPVMQPVQQAPVAPAPVPMAPAPVAEPAPQRAHNPLDGPAAGGGGGPAKPRHGFL
jgi:hypothetical protein